MVHKPQEGAVCFIVILVTGLIGTSLQDCIMIPIYCKSDILEYHIQYHAYHAYKYEPHKHKYEPQCLLVYKATSTQVRVSNLAARDEANS